MGMAELVQAWRLPSECSLNPRPCACRPSTPMHARCSPPPRLSTTPTLMVQCGRPALFPVSYPVASMAWLVRPVSQALDPL